MSYKISSRVNGGHCYFTDWLRSVACILVLTVHGMVVVQRIFNLNDTDRDMSDNYLLVLLHHGMPVFFYASGRAAFYSTKKSGEGGILNFLYKKTLRLIVPSVVGYFTVVAAAAYFGSEWRPCAPARPYTSLFDFYSRFLAEFKCSGLEWLWTLPMIFIISVLNRPFTLYLRNVRDKHSLFMPGMGKKESGYEAMKSFVMINSDMFMSISFLMTLMFLLHILLSFSVTGILIPVVLSYFTIPILTNMVSKVTLHQRNDSLITSFLAYLPLYISSAYIGLRLDDSVNSTFSADFDPRNVLVYGLRLAGDDRALRLCISLLFYNMYYLAGFLDLLFLVDEEAERNIYLNNFAPFKILILISLNALSFPGNKSLVSYIWAYPYYTGGITTCIFVIGTWVWLELFRVAGTQLFNSVKISESLQRHFSNSGIVIYITHSVWLEMVTRYFLLYVISPESSPYSLYDGKSIRVLGFVFPGFGMLSSWLILNASGLALSILAYISIVNFKVPRLFFGLSR
ncbi:transmembrane domain-containing protein [Cryptosporidium canis]|uniref:Transmembrane domain-containing protein n=1 Tax=Cryptosporidium canis TaxID=195482 RepID=A0A9D5DGJ6_9CRYT|nr:transmembrane domain-containing protein [Cryptosporidium canis]